MCRKRRLVVVNPPFIDLLQLSDLICWIKLKLILLFFFFFFNSILCISREPRLLFSYFHRSLSLTLCIYNPFVLNTYLIQYVYNIMYDTTGVVQQASF